VKNDEEESFGDHDDACLQKKLQRSLMK